MKLLFVLFLTLAESSGFSGSTPLSNEPIGFNGAIPLIHKPEIGDSYILSYSSWSLQKTDDGSICKVEGVNEYEPCSWQDEREAESERLRRVEQTKAKCRANGCLVVRQKVDVVYSTYPPTYPSDWRCDCDSKPKKKEKCK